MPIVGTPVPCAIYVDPGHLLCAYCAHPVHFVRTKPDVAFVGLASSGQVWCENPDCKAFNVLGDVPISTLPGSKHRTRGA
jgi:hypothetical protein